MHNFPSHRVRDEDFMQQQQLRLVASLTLILNYSFDLANNLNAILCGFHNIFERKLKLTIGVVRIEEEEQMGIEKNLLNLLTRIYLFIIKFPPLVAFISYLHHVQFTQKISN